MFGARRWFFVSLLSFTAFAGEPMKPAPVAQRSQQVLFNTRSLKFHAPSCEWARKCTRNCVKVTREEAVRRAGVPCKVCGGR